MVSLQTSCAEIPSLTSATQTGHASVTAFITEAQVRKEQHQARTRLAGTGCMLYGCSQGPPG
jgi:hypothetical protein